jgi:hypothetical protein
MYQQRQAGVNPLNGLNALKMYSNYQNGTGLMGLFNSGAAGGTAGGTGAAGMTGTAGAATGGTGATAGAGGAGGMAGMGGLGALGMFALPAYILGGLAAGSADPETFGKLPLVGTTGEALNGLFNGKGLTEFFDTDNIAQNLLPGIGDFLPDDTSESIFKPVQNMFGSIFGF